MCDLKEETVVWQHHVAFSILHDCIMAQQVFQYTVAASFICFLFSNSTYFETVANFCEWISRVWGRTCLLHLSIDQKKAGHQGTNCCSMLCSMFKICRPWIAAGSCVVSPLSCCSMLCNMFKICRPWMVAAGYTIWILHCPWQSSVPLVLFWYEVHWLKQYSVSNLARISPVCIECCNCSWVLSVEQNLC